jgi:hypothetical protein
MLPFSLCVLVVMPTGIVLFPNPQAVNRVDDVVAQATRAYDLGVPPGVGEPAKRS